MLKDFEMVIGLEVHIELGTKTKIFCGCSTEFGAAPNTHVCPVCMGLPGTLPVLNRQVVDYAIKAGLATHCEIAKFSKQDRKNYFYPDLPKAYQISQYDLPLCEHGWVEIESENGPKKIGITRIHIEEDAGKLVHDPKKGTMIDNNRCGVPLIEIVSEPDIRSAAEADAYLKKLRAYILYTGVSECKMNEGKMRCDVNLSVRPRGSDKFGTRTEMKNLNSFQFIQKAIEYEFRRQVEVIESGGEIVQETRRFDQLSGKTYSMRRKEDANDYRYFPDPDLIPIVMTDEDLNRLRREIPQLPDERKAQYMKDFGLSAYDGEMLTNEKFVADYFETAAKETKYPKILANLITTEIFRIMPPDATEMAISSAALAAIADMSGEGRINGGTAKKLVAEIWEKGGDPEEIVRTRDLEQISDTETLMRLAKEVLAENEKSVSDYKGGKTAAFGALMGKMMAKTHGKGNPIRCNEILTELLK